MNLKIKNVCVVTGTRAEYGQLKNLLKKINKSPLLNLQLIVTGMHLSHEFGDTYKEIINDGFVIDKKVETLLSSDTSTGLSKSIALGIIGFDEAYNQLKPHVILILGDRFEILASAIPAMIAKIPIAHLNGGELTEGLIDDPIRHSLTKMSQIHFVACEEYRQRVIQLGENPEYVYKVGGVGIDGINEFNLLSKANLEKSLNFNFGKKNLLITFHPLTLEDDKTNNQIKELLKSLRLLKDTNMIFTMPNADTNSRSIRILIEEFVRENPETTRVFKSLGQQKYLSCLKYVDAIVGNSSSGISEAPSFRKGTINIGDRQKGRVFASSVISADPNENSINEAFQKLYEIEFQKKLKTVKNPYGEGGASQKIINVLENIVFDNIVKKQFYDIR